MTDKGKPVAKYAPRFDRLTPAQMQDRLNRHACLGCGLEGMQIDPQTGLWDQHCFNCKSRLEKVDATPAEARATHASRKQHKEDSIANLDRLTGHTDAPPDRGHHGL